MQGILLQKKKESLAALYTGDSVAFRLYLEALQLKLQGEWREAGDKLLKSADLYNSFKMSLEAATISYEAAECYIKVDKNEAILAFSKSVKMYCDIGRFDIAGRIERKIALLHYRILHWDDAYQHFRKASDFFSGDRDLDQSDLCLEKAAECAVHVGNYLDAQQLFEIIAKSCVNTNLRRFQATKKLLKSILCMFAKEILIEEELPIMIAGKGGHLQAHLEKLKKQQQKQPHAMHAEGSGSIETLTSRTSMRSEDDHSSIATFEGKGNPQQLTSPKPTTNSTGFGVTSPAATTNQTAPTTPATNQTAPSATTTPAGKESIRDDHSSMTGRTSYNDSFQGNESLSSLSFQGMNEDQIVALLPENAKYNHNVPREWKYVMSDSLQIKYDEIKERCEYYCSIDSFWKGSKEYLFLKNLLKLRYECNYFEFIDHVYYWNNVNPLDEVSLILLKVPILEMQKEHANHKIVKLNIEVNNAIKNRRAKTFHMNESNYNK